MNKKFEIAFLEEAKEFLQEQDKKTRAKIFQGIEKAQTLNDKKFFKKLQGDTLGV